MRIALSAKRFSLYIGVQKGISYPLNLSPEFHKAVGKTKEHFLG